MKIIVNIIKMCIPFLLYIIGMVIISLCLTSMTIPSIAYINGLFDFSTPEPVVTELLDEAANSGDAFYVPANFPVIYPDEQWAALSIKAGGLIKAPVFAYDDSATLREGIGHFIGSRYPGQEGNVVLAAHVTTYFRCLEDLSIGDKVVIDAKYGRYVYKVSGRKIIEPTDISILDVNDGVEKLTLYTCYPYYSAGPRNKRIVLECEIVSGKNWIKGGKWYEKRE